MVSVKERTVKGNTYVYVSVTASFKGKKKRFEKSVGPKDMDQERMNRRIELLSGLLEVKKEIYLSYLEIEDTQFQFINRGYIFPLVQIRRQYKQFLSGMYPSEFEKYQQEFQVRYVHHTTAIEGNTLSLRDTALILDDGIAPANKELREIHEIDNYRQVLDFVNSYKKRIDQKLMTTLHGMIQRNIDDNTAGEIRRINVGISGSNWEPPSAVLVQDELDELFKWYSDNRKRIHPIELAGIFHHRLLQIHPFVDGNGRVAREMLNLILSQNGYPPLVIPVERREEYLNYLEMADEDNIVPLLEFFTTLLIEDYLTVVKSIQEDIKQKFGDLSENEQKDMLEVIVWASSLLGQYISIIPIHIQMKFIQLMLS